MEPAPLRQTAASFLLPECRVEPPVKNTFIHFNFGETDAVPEADGDGSVLRANYHRSHSDPVHGEGMSEHSTSGDSKQSSLRSLLRSGRLHVPPPFASEAQGSSHITSEARSLASSSASGNSLFSDAEAAKSEDHIYGATGSRAPPAPGSNLEAAPDLPEGIPSIGALGHYTGTCKPCAWNWKPGGCGNRGSCDFCHLCDPGELKRRRKERVAVIRKSEKEDKRRMAKAGAIVSSGADSGFSSSALAAMVASTLPSGMVAGTLPSGDVAPASPLNHQLEGHSPSHLMAKRSTRISL